MGQANFGFANIFPVLITESPPPKLVKTSNAANSSRVHLSTLSPPLCTLQSTQVPLQLSRARGEGCSLGHNMCHPPIMPKRGLLKGKEIICYCPYQQENRKRPRRVTLLPAAAAAARIHETS